MTPGLRTLIMENRKGCFSSACICRKGFCYTLAYLYPLSLLQEREERQIVTVARIFVLVSLFCCFDT